MPGNELTMKRLHIIGGKNHGKTTLIVELVRELRSRGERVGTIKHTHHRHELDTPGKDSHQHRTAGASVVGVLSRELGAVFVPNLGGADGGEDRYAALAPMYAHCDIVLVEGDTETNAPKIEVWRSALSTPPRYVDHPSVLAIVSDDAVPLQVPVLPRSDVTALVDWIMARLPAS